MPNILETVRSEDFVEYYIFLQQDCRQEELQEINNKIISSYDSLIENYIWHKDKFNLKKFGSPKENLPPHLYGIVFYGDNIEDEWFIVYLLLKISELSDNIFIRIVDNDGEFLLIEAANHLPGWIKPESCSEQIFIHKGVIRFSTNSIINKNNHSIIEKINLLKNVDEISSIERTVTESVNRRVQKFENGIDDFLHKSRAYVPAKVAALLDAKPNLIASVVTALCQRDIIDNKVCKKMENFPQKEIVLRSINFTKFLYAMISRHKILPEKRSDWKLPPLTSSDYREHHLGYKITSGFEILASRCSEKSKSDLKLSRKWNQYLEVLNRKGYFKGLLKGSKDYVELEKKARIYFLDNVGTEEPENNAVMNLLQTISYDFDEMKREEADIPPSDEEKWMEIDEDEFNKLLEERFGLEAVNVTNSPEVLSSTINKFLNQTSDLEGVEFKNDLSHNAMDVDENQQNFISFEPNDFFSSVEKMFGILKLDNQNDSLQDSESDDIEESESETEYEDSSVKSYMNQMDNELKNHLLNDNFMKKQNSLNEESKNLDPIDVDMNALTNIMKSYEEEFGGSGPAGNLLYSLQLRLDRAKNE